MGFRMEVQCEKSVGENVDMVVGVVDIVGQAPDMSLLLDRTFKRTAFERHHPPQQNPVHPSSARDLLHLVITLSSTASASFELLRACAHTAFSRSIVRRKVRRIAEQDHSIVVSFSEFYLPPNPGGPPRPWNPGGPPKPGGPPNPGGPPAGGNPAVIC